jgi:poly(3-hydroxybutyrate) depolymerase
VLLAILLLMALTAAPVALSWSPTKAQEQSFDYQDGSVFVHVPAHASDIGVLVLHSLGHTAIEPVAQGWSATSDRHGFVALYPQRGNSWNAGICCGIAAATSRDDVSWLATIVQMARVKYHLKTIYLAGFSNGGMMVERLVAEQPAISDRFAVWGAAPEMPTPGQWFGVGNLFQGSKDLFVPAAGGVVSFDGVTNRIRPAIATPDFLVGADLRTFVQNGFGHPPPSSWPEMAWAALVSSG